MTRPAKVTCPDCQNRVSQHMVRCVYCGYDLPVPPLPFRDCPRCQTPMEHRQGRWVVLDRCGACRGEFYDLDELELEHRLDMDQILTFTRQLPHAATVGRLACPACRQRMAALTVRGRREFVIDRCESCGGLWLDADEGEDLVAALSERWDKVDGGKFAFLGGSARPTSPELKAIGFLLLSQKL